MFPRMVFSFIATLLVGCGAISQSVQKEPLKVEKNQIPPSGNSTIKTSKTLETPKEQKEEITLPVPQPGSSKIKEQPSQKQKKKAIPPKEKEKTSNLLQGKEGKSTPKETNEKPTTQEENKTLPYEETIKKVALLVVAKNAPVVVTEKNLLFEGTLNKKQPLKGCSLVTVKVKDKKSKTEKDYLVAVCGDQIKIELKKGNKSQ
ncbi:MAG: hypothetical protein GXN97_00595 [Aquificae bacterium]|nr:hypothetical protein [Aquificota bacterium]